jgi:hypothetical protein
MNRIIGGELSLDAYARLAQQHRPTDPEALAAEARRLHRSGHSAIYIADALRMAPDEVAAALAAVNVGE